MYGATLLPRFRRILHPIQVVDLQDKNPQEVLKNYTTVENLRILVCGGDISLFHVVGGLTVRLDWLGVEHD